MHTFFPKVVKQKNHKIDPNKLFCLTPSPPPKKTETNFVVSLLVLALVSRVRISRMQDFFQFKVLFSIWISFEIHKDLLHPHCVTITRQHMCSLQGETVQLQERNGSPAKNGLIYGWESSDWILVISQLRPRSITPLKYVKNR